MIITLFKPKKGRKWHIKLPCRDDSRSCCQRAAIWGRTKVVKVDPDDYPISWTGPGESAHIDGLPICQNCYDAIERFWELGQALDM